MVRDFIIGLESRSRAENKRPIWASDRSSFSGAFWFEALWPRTSGLSPDPPWPLPARLAEPAFEGRFVPDAPAIMKIAARPSRFFFGIRLGLLQLVGYQFKVSPGAEYSDAQIAGHRRRHHL
jgi:hypothetical protein